MSELDAEAEPLEHAGAEVLDEDVGPVDGELCGWCEDGALKRLGDQGHPGEAL